MIGAFIEEINQAFPSVRLTLSDVTLVHRGLVPAATSTSGKSSSNATSVSTTRMTG